MYHSMMKILKKHPLKKNYTIKQADFLMIIKIQNSNNSLIKLIKIKFIKLKLKMKNQFRLLYKVEKNF